MIDFSCLTASTRQAHYIAFSVKSSSSAPSPRELMLYLVFLFFLMFAAVVFFFTGDCCRKPCINPYRSAIGPRWRTTWTVTISSVHPLLQTCFSPPTINFLQVLGQHGEGLTWLRALNMSGRLDKKGQFSSFKRGNKSSVCRDRCSGRMVHANQFVWSEQKRPAGPHGAGQAGLATTTTAGAPCLR